LPRRRTTAPGAKPGEQELTKLTTLACALLLPAIAQAQSIAFTFDDGLDPRTQAHAATWNDRILRALAADGVQSMVFPAGRNVDSSAGLELIRRWGQAGHAVGNHTYLHENFGSAQMNLNAFTADILRADALLKEIPGWTRRLRFPYLKEGETAGKRDGMRRWMTEHGYRPGPVSIDTSDWYFNQRYLQWRERHPGADPAPIRRAYLAHLWERAQYYDGLGKTVLGRSPAHVMLLHTNGINAQFLPDILSMFRQRSWTIISPKDAFDDPLYSTVTTTVPAGESILWALAKESGVAGLRYPAEDDVYEKPALDSLGL